MAVEVTTASGVRLDIITQGKFQPTYFGNFDLDSSKEDAATGETSFGSYDVYWMPITDGLISNIQSPGANPANGELDWDVFASKFDIDLGRGSRISPILTYSDNQQQGAKATYYGVEYIGNIGQDEAFHH